MLFSAPGTLTRYFISLSLNGRINTMPLGTLTANSFGTALVGVFHTLQNMNRMTLSNEACALVQGLIDGYCGCLTTISTFAVEIDALDGRRAWLYGGLSWLIGQGLLLLVIGPSAWAAGVAMKKSCSFVS